MEPAVSLTFVRRIPLARVFEYVQTAAYNFLVILYHLLDEALWLLRSAADSVQLGPEGVPYRALHVVILDRFKSFRDSCKLLRNSLPDIDAAFGNGQAALAVELKAVGFHYMFRILPGGLGTHATLIDDLPAAFSVLKRSAHDLVDGVDAFEQRIFRFRDCFVDPAWVETMVGNPVLVKGMVDVLYSIDNERWSIRNKLHEVSTGLIGIIPESV